MTPAAALVALHVAVALFGFAGLFGKWLAWARVASCSAAPSSRPSSGADLLGGAERAGRVRVGGQRRRPRHPLGGLLPGDPGDSVAIGLLGFASFPVFVVLLERLTGGVGHRPKVVLAGLVTAGLALLPADFSLAGRTCRACCGRWPGFTFAVLAIANREPGPALADDGRAVAERRVRCLCGVPLPLAGGWPRRSSARARWRCSRAGGGLHRARAHAVHPAWCGCAHTASVVAALEPVYGIVLAALLLGETPGPRTLGGALIVGACVLASRDGGRAGGRGRRWPPQRDSDSSGMIVVVMGVTGCGKSTVGAALATRSAGGSSMRTTSIRRPMSARWPRHAAHRRGPLALARPARRRDARRRLAGESVVLACSALREVYRQTIARAGDVRSCSSTARRGDRRAALRAQAPLHAAVAAAEPVRDARGPPRRSWST